MYYSLPPDAIEATPPLIPKRVTRSYENVKLKEKAADSPPLPPKKGYENVELKGKGENGTPSLGPNPPVPLRRTRVPLPSPTKEQDVCTLTPPIPRRARDKSPDRSKLFKAFSAPYCPVSPDSPEVRRKERKDSSPLIIPNETDDLTTSDTPNPYYSLPPDSADFDPPLVDFSDDELNKGDNDGDAEMLYLTLGNVPLIVKESKLHSLKPCPPLPPKVGQQWVGLFVWYS